MSTIKLPSPGLLGPDTPDIKGIFATAVAGSSWIEQLVASLLLVVRPRAPISFLFLVVRPGTPSSFLFLVVRPGAPSSVLAPSSKAKSPY